MEAKDEEPDVERGELISYLVKNKADVNAIDWTKSTPLHVAAKMGNMVAAMALLDCNDVDSDVSQTHIHNIQYNYDRSTARYLQCRFLGGGVGPRLYSR